MNTIPAGLLDENIEFFNAYPDGSVDDVYCLFNGERFEFSHFPPEVMELIDADMEVHPEKVLAMIDLGIDDIHEQRRKYISCNFGGFDGRPDVKDDTLQETEYWPCPQRGTCPVEGKLCNALKTPSGEHLTKREIEVLKLVAIGHLDKEIGSALNMSELTVKTHNSRIQNKIGPNTRKADMVRFACQHNLI